MKQAQNITQCTVCYFYYDTTFLSNDRARVYNSIKLLKKKCKFDARINVKKRSVECVIYFVVQNYNTLVTTDRTVANWVNVAKQPMN